MCRIAAQHDTARSQTLGDRDVHPPQPDAAHLDVEVGHADRATHPLLDTIGAPQVATPLVGWHRDLTQPASAGVQRLQHTCGPGIRNEEQDTFSVCDVMLDAGAEVAIDEVVDALFAFQRDAQLLTDQAVDAVGGDERLAGQRVGL